MAPPPAHSRASGNPGPDWVPAFAGTRGNKRMTAFVALDDVSHVYGGAGGTLAVDGLSIHVNRGEFAAVGLAPRAAANPP